MKVTLVGATGGVGSHLLRMALEKDYELTLVARHPERLPALPDTTRVIAADLRDHAKLREAVAEADAVLWAVGATRNTADQPAIFRESLEVVLAAMPLNARIVMISGAGVHLDGDELPLGRRFLIRLMKTVAGHVLTTNVAQAEAAKSSDKDYVLVRPGMMPDKTPSGRVTANESLPPKNTTTKADVARFMIEQLEHDDWLRKAPFVSG